MKIINASYEMLPPMGGNGLKLIEIAGRTCYQSADKIAMGTDEKFVRNCIKRGHEAMLEHSNYIFRVDMHVSETLQKEWKRMESRIGQRAMIEMSRRPDGTGIVSGNLRAWRDLFRMCDEANSILGGYFAPYFDEWMVQDVACDWEMYARDPWIVPISENALRSAEEKMTHVRRAVRFTVDRGVSHELVRHRVFSFAQESTRYCRYEGGITVVKPFYLDGNEQAYTLWSGAMAASERAYCEMLNNGCTPQEARAALPTSVKTELIMTGSLRAWQHFFDLRARQVTGRAHPQMEEIAVPLWSDFKREYAGVIK